MAKRCFSRGQAIVLSKIMVRCVANCGEFVAQRWSLGGAVSELSFPAHSLRFICRILAGSEELFLFSGSGIE
jgi:hypothetical protein